MQELGYLVSVAKCKIALKHGGFYGYLTRDFVDIYVCDPAHRWHEGSSIRIVVRRGSVAAERGRGALARAARLLELSPQPVCAGELSGVHVGRAASELCPVRTTERSADRGLRARGACSRGTARVG